MLLSFYYAIKLTLAKSLQTLSAPLQADRKRKRSQEFEDPPICAPTKRLQKRSQTSVADTNDINPIKCWIQEGSWPKEYFEQESDMGHQLVRKRSSSSLPGKQSKAGTPSTTTPSDQLPREAKSVWYNRPS